MMKVAINGWGRIGRIVFRAALRNDSNVDFVAINSISTFLQSLVAPIAVEWFVNGKDCIVMHAATDVG